MLNFDYFTYTSETSDFKITNYNSVDLTEVREYLASLDSKWFVQYRLREGIKIEKVMLDFYGTSKYTDIVLFLNGIEAIFGMPVVYDVVDDAVLQDTENYYNRVFGDQFFLERPFQKIHGLDDFDEIPERLPDGSINPEKTEYGNTLNLRQNLKTRIEALRNKLRTDLETSELDSNLKKTVIYLPIPTKISLIASKINEILKTQKEMYDLGELEHSA